MYTVFFDQSLYMSNQKLRVQSHASITRLTSTLRVALTSAWFCISLYNTDIRQIYQPFYSIKESKTRLVFRWNYCSSNMYQWIPWLKKICFGLLSPVTTKVLNNSDVKRVGKSKVSPKKDGWKTYCCKNVLRIKLDWKVIVTEEQPRQFRELSLLAAWQP